MSSKLKKRKRYSKDERRIHAEIQALTIPKKEVMKKAFDTSNKYVMEKLLPVFVLYLVDHFHCKENGVIKFMNWFNEMQEWLDRYPEGFEDVRKELCEKASVEIEY